jgi:hypothetical protein
LFHTLSAGAGPGEASVVPPTPVTKGWLAGSSTAGVPLRFCPAMKQSSAPLSPAAATIVWPWAAASWNSVLSAVASEEPSIGSHWPHEVVMTLARSWLIIAL